MRRLLIASVALCACLGGVAASQLLQSTLASGPRQLSGPSAAGLRSALITGAKDASGVPVGLLLVPAGCPLQATTAEVPAPGGVVIARIVAPPPSLTASVEAIFPPQVCDGRQYSASAAAKVKAIVDASPISFRVLSQVRYTGTGGAATLLTAVPSTQAVSDGLELGDPAGNLPDGTRLWSTSNLDEDTGGAGYTVQWFENGDIVQLTSTDLSLDTLETLARQVTVS